MPRGPNDRSGQSIGQHWMSHRKYKKNKYRNLRKCLTENTRRSEYKYKENIKYTSVK